MTRARGSDPEDSDARGSDPVDRDGDGARADQRDTDDRVADHGHELPPTLAHELEELHEELHVPAEGVPHPRLQRWQLGLLIAPIIAMVIATNVGNALFTTLADNQSPGKLTLLIALSSVNRNLILASNYISPWAYYPIGFIRLVLPDPFFYALGLLYGERALSWMEHRTPTIGSMLRWLERAFAKGLGYPLVLIMPNNYVCLIAGAARMRLRWFISLNVIGTIGRLIIMAWIGETFDGIVTTFFDFARSYRWQLFAVSIALVGFTMWREARLGNTEVQRLLELEDELVELEEETPP